MTTGRSPHASRHETRLTRLAAVYFMQIRASPDKRAKIAPESRNQIPLILRGARIILPWATRSRATQTVATIRTLQVYRYCIISKLVKIRREVSITIYLIFYLSSLSTGAKSCVSISGQLEYIDYLQRVHQSFSKSVIGIISVLSNSSVTLIYDVAFHTRVIAQLLFLQRVRIVRILSLFLLAPFTREIV